MAGGALGRGVAIALGMALRAIDLAVAAIQGKGDRMFERMVGRHNRPLPIIDGVAFRAVRTEIKVRMVRGSGRVIVGFVASEAIDGGIRIRPVLMAIRAGGHSVPALE